MIISASRRTDIPAFYSTWFMNRIRAGHCTVANPYNPRQLTRVDLRPEAVTMIVFWTRNSEPLLKHLRELTETGYHYYFLFTITGYGRDLEGHTPRASEAVAAFKKLSEYIGRDKVIWRYDPLILSSASDEAWHKKNFSALCRALKDHTRTVILSVLDPYEKTKARLAKGTKRGFHLHENAYSLVAYEKVLKDCARSAAKNGLEVQACAEDPQVYAWGITSGKCIDDKRIARLTGRSVSPRKDPSQRKLCMCARSKDIGAPDTCLFGCTYCYATKRIELARKNFTRHDPTASALIGGCEAFPPQPKAETGQHELF